MSTMKVIKLYNNPVQTKEIMAVVMFGYPSLINIIGFYDFICIWNELSDDFESLTPWKET